MDVEQLNALLQPYLKRQAIARFADPERASGYCKDASFDLAAWLSGRVEGVSVLNLSEPHGFDVARAQRFWQGANMSYASHYVVRVGELAVDLTARQFDSSAPFPLIKPVLALADNWGVAYDLAEPLTAGPLWSTRLWGQPEPAAPATSTAPAAPAAPAVSADRLRCF